MTKTKPTKRAAKPKPGVLQTPAQTLTQAEAIPALLKGDWQIVIGLRTCNPDGTSHGGFEWPEAGWVEAPDWHIRPVRRSLTM